MQNVGFCQLHSWGDEEVMKVMRLQMIYHVVILSKRISFQLNKANAMLIKSQLV